MPGKIPVKNIVKIYGLGSTPEEYRSIVILQRFSDWNSV
jgi:hypothetical protein